MIGHPLTVYGSGRQPPPKPSDCPLDWGHSVSAGIAETGHVLCAGDTLLTGDYGVLAYGHRLDNGR